jgi:hypothetical protein
MALLLYISSLLLIIRKRKSLLSFFLILQVISLASLILINTENIIDTPRRLLNLFYTIIVLSIIFYPWRKYTRIAEVYAVNEARVMNLTKILLAFTSIIFIVLAISSISILTSITDINSFKYLAGEREYYLYNQLPINVKLYILATISYSISYFLIPLHFFHLQRKNTLVSSLCILMSLNIILFGITFFSRWTITHYLLVYFSFFLLFRKNLHAKYISILKKAALVGLVLIGLLFIDITERRFSTDQWYISKVIPQNSLIQNPSIYSSLDYISQWYNNSFIVLDNYEGKTFGGRASFGPLLRFISLFTPMNWDPGNYQKLRVHLLGYRYYYKFTGLVANLVYDFGYILTFIFVFIFSTVIKKIRPVENRISINHLLLMVLLIQIPLLAIFYSLVGGIIVNLLYWVFMNIYLKYRIT